MEFIDSSKSILENIYFMSGAVLAVLGLVAIWQLIIGIRSFKTAREALYQAKDEFQISSQRNAAYLAAQLCERFTNEIFPKIIEFEKENDIKGYPKVIGGIDRFDMKAKIKIEDEEMAVKSIDELFMPKAEFYLNILNEFEAFAMYFTKKIADEDIAYQTVGKTFCDYVEYYHPVILIMNTSQHGTSYRNLRELYKIWSARNKKQNLENLAQIVKEELGKTITSEIEPFGTNKK